jgi:hypothetical protein
MNDANDVHQVFYNFVNDTWRYRPATPGCMRLISSRNPMFRTSRSK